MTCMGECKHYNVIVCNQKEKYDPHRCLASACKQTNPRFDVDPPVALHR